jgi:hypothetical protein
MNYFSEFWTSWSDFSTCTKFCGGGEMTKTRSCTNGSPGVGLCDGVASETLSCEEQSCGK